jgi:hypothetical protein
VIGISYRRWSGAAAHKNTPFRRLQQNCLSKSGGRVDNCCSSIFCELPMAADPSEENCHGEQQH